MNRGKYVPTKQIEFLKKRQSQPGRAKSPRPPPVAGHFRAWLVTFKINPPIWRGRFLTLGEAENVDNKHKGRWKKITAEEIKENNTKGTFKFPLRCLHCFIYIER